MDGSIKTIGLVIEKGGNMKTISLIMVRRLRKNGLNDEEIAKIMIGEEATAKDLEVAIWSTIKQKMGGV